MAASTSPAEEDAQLWHADTTTMDTETLTAPPSHAGSQRTHLDSTDCDDTTASVSPGEAEICGDGPTTSAMVRSMTPATDALTWYADTDNDSFGDANNTTLACLAPLGYTSNSDDCDDNDDDTYPGADEICNGVDDDCDVSIDELAVDALTWYNDNDGDEFGDLNSSLVDCNQPQGYVLDSTDCDDNDILISPDGIEVCDGVDNNCDGSTDETTALDATKYCLDGDNDNRRWLHLISCAQPGGYVRQHRL